MSGLVTPEEYARLKPRSQGYITYMEAERPGSRIPKKCPYREDSREAKAWHAGEFDGVLEAQDCDN